MRNKKDFLTWAISLLKDAQNQKLYGTTTFFYEAGRITRAETKKSEMPKEPVERIKSPRNIGYGA